MDYLASGGWAAYLAALLGVAGAACAVAFAISGASWARITARVLMALTLAVGVWGHVSGRARVHEALLSVDPSLRAELLVVGQREAAVPLHVGLGGLVAVAVPMVVGGLRFGRGKRPPRRPRPPARPT